jgi:hypothetical protein
MKLETWLLAILDRDNDLAKSMQDRDLADRYGTKKEGPHDLCFIQLEPDSRKRRAAFCQNRTVRL